MGAPREPGRLRPIGALVKLVWICSQEKTEGCHGQQSEATLLCAQPSAARGLPRAAGSCPAPQATCCLNDRHAAAPGSPAGSELAESKAREQSRPLKSNREALTRSPEQGAGTEALRAAHPGPLLVSRLLPGPDSEGLVGREQTRPGHSSERSQPKVTPCPQGP